MGAPIHTTVLPDEGKSPADYTLAEWQGILEELHYQADNQSEPLFLQAHDAMRWLVDHYLARRLNDDDRPDPVAG